MLVPDHKVPFGASLGQCNGADAADAAERIQLGTQADRDGLDLFTLVRALSGGGDPVTFDGEFYHVTELDPAAVPAPRVFTGSVGPKSLAVTGRLADGWIPPGGSDWLSQLYRESRPYAAGFIYRKHRRHPRRPGPGPLGHRDSPRRPRGHHPLARARITVTVGGATCTTSD